MSCLKCGQETSENELFCGECLKVMEKYPVKPGIAIQLPHREETASIKRTVTRKKQPLTPEEMVPILKKRFWRMFVIWLVTLILLGLTTYPTIVFVQKWNVHLPGQNYSTITTVETAEP